MIKYPGTKARTLNFLEDSMTEYKRVMLKLTGELFGDDNGMGINFDKVEVIAKYISHLRNVHNTDLVIVIGGGNIFRGRNLTKENFDLSMGDYIGMLATVQNSIALQGKLEICKVESRLMSAFEMKSVCEPYILKRARRHLEKGRVVIISGGIGIPGYSTDTAAANYANQLNCEIVLKGSTIDGVYTADPKKDKTAQKLASLSFQDALEKDIMVMDSTAFAICKTQNIPIIVFDISDLENIERILRKEEIGTLIS